MLTDEKIQENKEEIITILGCVLAVPREAELRKFLEESDFFTAPASSKYHNAFKGGLSDHALKTYRLFHEKCAKFCLNVSPRTIAVCALMHDICKANHYEFQKYKTKEGGKYTVSDNFPAGHGEKSVFILQRYLQLTEQEILLIRWHMGESAIGGMYERMDFDRAREQEPALTALICADLEASFILEERPKKEE